MFNPHSWILLDSSNTHIRVNMPTQQIRFWLLRPDGDLFALLAQEMDSQISSSNLTPSERSVRRGNWQFILMGVAAREQLMAPEAITLMMQKLEQQGRMPFVNMVWRYFQLCRSVSRLVNETATEFELPEGLKDFRKVWGETILRSAASDSVFSSKTNYRTALKASAKALKEKRNPFPKEESPEHYSVIEAALMLAHWDDEVQAVVSRLPHKTRQTRYALRRDVKYYLREYRLAIGALATHIQNSSGLKFTRKNKAGQLCAVRDRNRLDPVLMDPLSEEMTN
jgi:hypothetical protein